MYAFPNFHGSSPHSVLENDLNAKTRHLSVNVKTRSSLTIGHKVDLTFSRCMHDPSFMALALIVSEKMTYTQNLDILSVNRKSRSSLKIEHRVDLNSSRCMHHPSFMALALMIFEEMT